jgi:hypothetical protein
MRIRSRHFTVFFALVWLVVQLPAQSSSSHHHAGKSAAETSFDLGSVNNGIYRNRSLGLTCKIPEGWVLRTDEMNREQTQRPDGTKDSASNPADANASSAGARVLLAAFSRPPEAKGEEVNSSILIAAEPVKAYPGMTDAVQYFGPLTEVTEAQGFTKDDEGPYEVAIGPQTLVRADYHKDVGTRVMRQSTLVLFSRGYAVSITVIAGSDEGIDQLLNGLDFQGTARSAK